MNPQPKHLSSEARRAVTVDAVVELAARQNPSDISTHAIAQHMGVTQGALFRHFPNKDAILQAVMEWVADRMLSRIDGATASAASPAEALRAAFLANTRFIAEHPGVPRMIFGELQRPDESMPKRLVQTMIAGYRQRLNHLIQAAKAAGQVNPHLDADAAITLFIGSIQGLVMQSLLANDVARIEREAPRVWSILSVAMGVKP